jgi:hypothetical protein
VSDRLLPPERSACTRTSCVPGSLCRFRGVLTAWSLGLRAVFRGTGCFTTPVNASADRSWTRAAIASPPRPDMRGGSERGRYLPTAPIAIEPLTSLSPLSLPRSLGAPSRLLRARSLSRAELLRVRKPPRSPFPPPREREWLDTTRDAFCRQGPFVGSGGLYSPGPATASAPFGRCDDR